MISQFIMRTFLIALALFINSSFQAFANYIYLDDGQKSLASHVSDLENDPYFYAGSEDYFIALFSLCYKNRNIEAALAELVEAVDQNYFSKEGEYFYLSSYDKTKTAQMSLEEMDIDSAYGEDFIRLRYFVFDGGNGGEVFYQYIPYCGQGLSLEELSDRLRILEKKLSKF